MAAREKKSVLAKSPDGTVQFNFTIPWNEVKKETEKAALELGKNTSVPGFRKGKAPLTQLLNHLPKESITQKALQNLLPKLFAESLKEHKISPATYPKFEIIKANEGGDWQIRAITYELPEIKLGDYKKIVRDALTTKSSKTNQKGKQGKKKELSTEEKQQEVIKALLENIKITIPALLTKEEVETRLVSLLERLEKLGLSLESYLASIKKDPQTIREEYKKQAEENISLELILNQIAKEESVIVKEKDIDSFIEIAGKGDRFLKEKLETPEQRQILRSIIRKRKVLDQLTSLA